MRWPLTAAGARSVAAGPCGAAHGQVRLAIQPVDLLVVHVGKLRAQQIVQAAIAEPAADLGQFDDPCGQGQHGGRRFGRVTKGIAGQPRKAAGPALAQRGELEHALDRLALALRG